VNAVLPDSLVQVLRRGNRLALARLLTQVENNTPDGQAALNDLFPFGGQAHLVGITGAPGTGKSTLVNQIAKQYRHPTKGQSPYRVAIIAVDPTSPFTGGAFLGDRLRMRDLAGDPGVFIRSMASRGALGGLAHTTAAVVQVLDAAGFDKILIETCGVGQAEVEIAHLAHTTLVLETPGLGDDIQVIKAGILEIADILVVNKGDQPGAERTERDLRDALQMASSERISGWSVPVLTTVANKGAGINELIKAIADHRDYLVSSGEWQKRSGARIQAELEGLLQEALVARWRATIPSDRYQQTLESLLQRQISPYEAVNLLTSN
jgi:GTPase